MDHRTECLSRQQPEADVRFAAGGNDHFTYPSVDGGFRRFEFGLHTAMGNASRDQLAALFRVTSGSTAPAASFTPGTSVRNKSLEAPQPAAQETAI